MVNEAEYWERILEEYEKRIKKLELDRDRYKILVENCRKAAVEEINRNP